MSAYYRASFQEFLDHSAEAVVGELTRHQTGTTPEQLRSWQQEVTVLRETLSDACGSDPRVSQWGLLLEYQMFRLHRRIDAVLLTDRAILVVEFKVGVREYDSAGIRQVEDYALDLRDFHAGSTYRTIVPVLCATAAESKGLSDFVLHENIADVLCANASNLGSTLVWAYQKAPTASVGSLSLGEWDGAPYAPVPNIIEAAELLYAAHDVEDIHSALAEQKNLAATSDRLIEIIAAARRDKRKAVCFVTGVPGSGKTLTGLNAVHDPRFRDTGGASGAFLSGNTPLVEVLREALAQDHRRRMGGTIDAARRKTKAEIQLLMRYLEEYENRDTARPPHEHVIVFDEAQRAWDAAYGKQKFGREASEPTLFLEIMARHADWAVIIALVGGGQEINKGEGGLLEWGDALAEFDPSQFGGKGWDVYASPHVLEGTAVTAGGVLFPEGAPDSVTVYSDDSLHLPVSIRSHRCEAANAWIDAVLNGSQTRAKALAGELDYFPIYMTRSLRDMREWLHSNTRGYRRCGLLASSNARRLRGYGLGATLSTQDLGAIKNWFLMPRGDVRASYQLEVTATEYACQGLELDRVGLCWGGDMTWSHVDGVWVYRTFRCHTEEDKNCYYFQLHVLCFSILCHPALILSSSLVCH